MPQAAPTRRVAKQAASGGMELLKPSERSGVLTIPEDALIAWAASKLGCEPKKVKVLSHEEQHDITLDAPDPKWPKMSRMHRVRVTYEEANYGHDSKVTVMLHGQEWGAAPAKGRYNVPGDTTKEVIESRGWRTEKKRKGRR